MKIAFISVRGIPNNYGGFEQFAEYISVGLVQRGHEVTIYSPSYHPYREDEYKGVKIIHIYSPEKWMGGSLGSFFYDFLSLRHALRKGNYDIIYEAGYTSIIPAYIWYGVNKLKSPIFVTNMDGLEYKRTKFNGLVRKFVFWEEKMAVKYSHYLIADNMGIHDYYKEKYNKESKFLAYGAELCYDFKKEYLNEYDLSQYSYFLIIARIEPENNLEIAIKGYLQSNKTDIPLIIIGKTNTSYAKKLVKKYEKYTSVRFIGGIYDFNKINSIRKFSYGYFHGHCVGGTNPSLLEAMASDCFIMSHDNIFNRSVLKDNALYYKTPQDVTEILNSFGFHISNVRDSFIKANRMEIKNNYSWDKLVEQHEAYFMELLSNNYKYSRE